MLLLWLSEQHLCAWFEAKNKAGDPDLPALFYNVLRNCGSVVVPQ